MTEHTVIVGGTAGIGLATARALATEGLVTVVGRDPERLKQALDSIGDERAQGRVASMTDRAALDALFTQLGPIDHLVVTAPGTGCPGPLAELDLERLEQAFSTKLTGTAHAVQAALPHLSKQGSITLVSAGSAQAALPGTAGLAAVNGAIEVLVPTLALELAPIRVNCVSPGVVDTDWWERVGSAEQRAEVLAGFTARIPAGRPGRPEEVADVIAMLVRNAYLTGVVIPVDGGLRLKP